MNPNGNDAMNIPKWDYWTPTNTDAEFPSIAYNYAQTKAVKPIDRSFIKLQKVAVSYNLSDLVKQYGINALSVSLSADNLATYAPHWFGLDPETNQGITTGAVPSIRTYLLGVTFEF